MNNAKSNSVNTKGHRKRKCKDNSISQISTEQAEFLRKQRNDKVLICSIRWLIFIGFLILWEIAAGQEWINSFIFCSPSIIAKCFWEMLQSGTLFQHVGITLLETFVSFAVVILGSILVAILLWWNPKLSKILEPYLVVLNSLPKSALAPILIVWLGANYQTIIVCAISVAVFGSILNIYTGFVTIEPEKIKLIQTLGGNRFDCLRLVVIPGSLENIFSVMKVNIGLCLVGVIIGEFLAARAGLGYLIIYGSQVFKMDWVLLAIILLCIIAMLLYAVLQAFEKKRRF